MKNLRVLLVEDDVYVANGWQDALADLRLHVDVAQDVPQAIKLLKRARYDFVVLDLRIPGEAAGVKHMQTQGGVLAGYYLGRFIKRNWPKTRIVLMSMSCPAEVRQWCYETK